MSVFAVCGVISVDIYSVWFKLQAIQFRSKRVSSWLCNSAAAVCALEYNQSCAFYKYKAAANSFAANSFFLVPTAGISTCIAT